jgi:hypothetical protein
MQPSHTDYVAMCGNKLEFQITPGSEEQVLKPIKAHLHVRFQSPILLSVQD